MVRTDAALPLLTDAPDAAAGISRLGAAAPELADTPVPATGITRTAAAEPDAADDPVAVTGSAEPELPLNGQTTAAQRVDAESVPA
jgi:hypothetical protein